MHAETIAGLPRDFAVNQSDERESLCPATTPVSALQSFLDDEDMPSPFSSLSVFFQSDLLSNSHSSPRAVALQPQAGKLEYAASSREFVWRVGGELLLYRYVS